MQYALDFTSYTVPGIGTHYTRHKLNALHWLLLFSNRIINQMAPEYLKDIITLSEPKYNTRSSDKLQLDYKRTSYDCKHQPPSLCYYDKDYKWHH
jgi:hypothetical protein